MIDPIALDSTPYLEALAQGHSPKQVLTELVLALERGWTGSPMWASVLLLEGGRLRHGAAPSLPDDYNRQIDGLVPGPGVGSCGTAAYCGHAIFVADIASDPLWDDFRELALKYGLRACWSVPILARDGRVLGTFAIYYGERRAPTERERIVIRRAAEMARDILLFAGSSPHDLHAP